ncbi:class I SAM-dependent methyltransferase [Paenibacillus tarimensis]
MNRIDYIREEEKKYHETCFDNYNLFEKGSWLHKPVKTVMDLLSLFEGKEEIRILDLGSGVGRNSIPVAEQLKGRKGQVVCVDLLETALSKLKAYSKEYGVEDYIKTIGCDIGEYDICPNHYDMIVAVSTLEHVRSKDILESVLARMADGTKLNGVNCIIMNTNVKETDLMTGQKLDALIEVNMSTEQSRDILHQAYAGWDILKSLVKPLEFEIQRDGKPVLLKTDCVTLVTRKK